MLNTLVFTLYDDVVLFSYGNYVLVSCKTKTADANNRVLVCDFINETVDIVPFQVKSFAEDGGVLYTGDSLTQSVYQTFSGFDDLGSVLENFITSKSDDFGNNTKLKKYKSLILRGLISAGQSYDVFADFDDSTFTLIGNVSGDAGYVDTENPDIIGYNLIGDGVVGGEGTTIAFPYLVSLKIKTPKFRVRALKFVAKGFGYVSIKNQVDFDIWTYEDKIPKKFRQKQNVSINDGTVTDLAEPNY